MKVNRTTILWAARKSATVADIAKILGRKPEYEEKIWNKILRFYPAVENFLKRNESLQEMREYRLDEDWESLKESRLEYIKATDRLMNSKLI